MLDPKTTGTRGPTDDQSRTSVPPNKNYRGISIGHSQHGWLLSRLSVHWAGKGVTERTDASLRRPGAQWIEHTDTKTEEAEGKLAVHDQRGPISPPSDNNSRRRNSKTSGKQHNTGNSSAPRELIRNYPTVIGAPLGRSRTPTARFVTVRVISIET